MSQAAPLSPSFDELYAQIEALPRGVTGEILEPGVIRTLSRPAKPHRWAAKRILLGLGEKDIGSGGTGWWIEVETEVRFGERLAVPDLSGWRVERVLELPNENPLTVMPDWCCEVLSPGTARDDKRLKLPLYAASGVPWLWLVDPALRLLEIYETMKGRPALAMTLAEDEKAAPPPFDIPLEVGSWWLPAVPPTKPR